MIVLEAKSEPRSGSMGSGGSSPSGEQGRSPASNSQSKGFQRNHVVLPLKAGQFCIMVDDSDGGRFPEGLYDPDACPPIGGLHRVERAAAKTYLGLAYSKRDRVFAEEPKRYRREHVLAVTETFEQMIALADQLTNLIHQARHEERDTVQRIRNQARVDILSLFPETYSIQKGAA
ncbi:hypothetical protein JS562_41425 [Agrobacterium sp. S2]|nr:hypothetical protein [Agrobacterium sp. S2]